MKRREFLVGTAAGAGAAIAARSLRAQEPGASEFDPSDWASVRSQFALAPELVHLNAMFISTHPAPVREAIARYRKALDEDPVRQLIEQGSELRFAVVKEAAAFFGASEENVALTDSTTMGLALLYHGLRLEPGDELIVEDPSYYSTIDALQSKADRSGAKLRKVVIYDEPETVTAEEIVDRLFEGVTSRTRVMALTWVHSDTGLKLPLRAIAERLADVNGARSEEERILLCVDGVHGFGVHDTNIGALGCDFFVAGTHKWVFGPRGTGVVYAARAEAWSRLDPLIPPFGLQTTPGLRHTPGGFHSFEHRWALADAFRFIKRIGLDRIEARTQQLASQVKQKLRELDGVRVLTPDSPDLSAGIVAFAVEGYEPVTIARRLRAQDIIVTGSSWGVPSIRATPSLLNDEQDVDRFAQALSGIR